MSFLFQPITIGDMTLKNRIVMAPMCMYQAVEGLVNEWHLIHYASRAIGGAGLIVVEATAVDPIGRISKEDLGLWEDGQIEGHRILVDHLHRYGAKAGVQLGHAGRKAQVGFGRVLAPSEIPFSEAYKTPEAMDQEQIDQAVEQFKQAAKRALESGYDLVEIHGAHGYLINQFLSPLTNHRTDQYGGSLENRARFLIEVIKGVRSLWPKEKPLMVRFSADEFEVGGNTPQDIADICKMIKPLGVNIANVSSGGVVNVPVKAYPGYQVGYAAHVSREGDILTVAGGLVTEAEQANEILANQSADMIFLGRELLRNPYWPLQAASVLGEEVEWPKPYERAKK